MNDQLEQALQQIEDEKGIPRAEILAMIEASLAAAFRKDYGKKDQNVQVEFDPENLSVKVFDVKEVVKDEAAVEVEGVESEFDPQKQITVEEAKKIKKSHKVGDIIKTDITPKTGTNFGRIAAQTAKQVIIQKLREAERNMQFSDFKAKERTLQNAIVQRIEGDTVLADLGKATGVLFPSEQIRGERYAIGQRLKVLILHVEPAAKGPKITLSRCHPDMVRKLFELEVPEVFNGTVEIKAVAREAGSRSKIAVIANQDGIDPIGACVGQKGSRVQTVMAELGGEKIDIILFDEDQVKFIANALSPAKILSVQLNEEEKEAKVEVLEDQLSLAIGKAGQNVRLAARLTGWKIDISGLKIGGEEKAEETVEEIKTEEATETGNS
ncbi:MAG: transcription termination/antitermination protein NusA [Candidatus Doudnabacteria bacterium]|nr:transcription termination/antitermination protein NusA [Candidatus Doudnabacteria bacterium]